MAARGTTKTSLLQRYTEALPKPGGGRTFDPQLFMSHVDVLHDEKIDWIAQTYIEHRGLVDLMRLIEPGVRDALSP
jgi:hypothetical protein